MYIDGFVQESRNSIANAQELRLSCTKPSIYYWTKYPTYDSDVYDGVGESAIIDALRPKQNGRNFADDIVRYIFLNENTYISIKIQLDSFQLHLSHH